MHIVLYVIFAAKLRVEMNKVLGNGRIRRETSKLVSVGVSKMLLDSQG